MRLAIGIAVCSIFAVAPAQAAQPVIVPIPPVSAAPHVTPAVSQSLTFQVAANENLTQLLLESDVDPDDAIAVDRLAQGYDGRGKSGCTIELTVNKASPGEGGHLRLQRVFLRTEQSRLVLERRDGALAVSAAVRASRRPIT